MTRHEDLEMLRELLPAWVRGELDSARTREVQAAVDGDPELQNEVEVIRAIYTARCEPPEGLESGVIESVRGVATRRNPSWALRIAAVVIVSLGSVAVWQQLRTSGAGGYMLGAAVSDWSLDEGIVAGGLVFDELSEEDLAVLLEELEENAS